mmetsp:Transcript_42303/g.127851  ORF Transcript_42303/g.127851 Transcript_42303/m.127851 type:complete len:204 (+) Transcript_42303:1003-1614(+)
MVGLQQTCLGVLVDDFTGQHGRVEHAALAGVHEPRELALHVRSGALHGWAPVLRLLLRLQIRLHGVSCRHAFRKHAEGKHRAVGPAQTRFKGCDLALLRDEAGQRALRGRSPELIHVASAAAVGVQHAPSFVLRRAKHLRRGRSGRRTKKLVEQVVGLLLVQLPGIVRVVLVEKDRQLLIQGQLHERVKALLFDSQHNAQGCE